MDRPGVHLGARKTKTMFNVTFNDYTLVTVELLCIPRAPSVYLILNVESMENNTVTKTGPTLRQNFNFNLLKEVRATFLSTKISCCDMTHALMTL